MAHEQRGMDGHAIDVRIGVEGVFTVEITEGNITISDRPVICIDGVPIGPKMKIQTVEKAILTLVQRIDKLRTENESLRKELTNATD